jgi:rubrerythrin
MLDRLDKKMDSIIKQNEPPEDVTELFDKIREDNRNPKYICNECGHRKVL